MKPSLYLPDDPEAIRSEIDTTRHRMDETIDALGQRLKGRHLLDEALHLFRKNQENGNMTKLKNKISDSADAAYHSVVDTIKSHPVPIALVGAGVGWLIYERTRTTKDAAEDEPTDAYRGVPPYDDDFSPEPLSGEAAVGGIMPEAQARFGTCSLSSEEESSGTMSTLKQKASDVGNRLRETSAEAKEKARRLYEQSRDRVSSAVETHPLQSGLVCLAVGLVAGLLIPTPRRLRQSVAPKARELSERMRDKAQDLMERGSHVVESATQAAKEEAKAQGLTSQGSGQESPEEKGLTSGATYNG